jgi:hypothetical protein
MWAHCLPLLRRAAGRPGGRAQVLRREIKPSYRPPVSSEADTRHFERQFTREAPVDSVAAGEEPGAAAATTTAGKGQKPAAAAGAGGLLQSMFKFGSAPAGGGTADSGSTAARPSLTDMYIQDFSYTNPSVLTPADDDFGFAAAGLGFASPAGVGPVAITPAIKVPDVDESPRFGDLSKLHLK